MTVKEASKGIKLLYCEDCEWKGCEHCPHGIAIEALEKYKTMKQTIYNASQRIQKLIDTQENKMVNLCWNLKELERIQDELVGVLEDGSE